MNKEENTLLAKWLDQSITPEELKQLEQDVDLEALKGVLDLQSAFELEVSDANSMWDSFSDKVKIDQPKQLDKAPEAKIIPFYRRRSFIGTVAAMFIGVIGFFVFQTVTQPMVLATVRSEQKNSNACRWIDRKNQSRVESTLS